LGFGLALVERLVEALRVEGYTSKACQAELIDLKISFNEAASLIKEKSNIKNKSAF
jgi:hypothetical protein